mmetsp:Transcript_29665/g.78650  ORF Transcript_29665/g.78650 Transcript_29665/m.78650 type:complete len:200 (-) Transcript_29665:919-1518(-)
MSLSAQYDVEQGVPARRESHSQRKSRNRGSKASSPMETVETAPLGSVQDKRTNAPTANEVVAEHQQSRCLVPSLTPRQRAHEIEKSNQKNLEAAPSIEDGMQKAKLHHRPVAPDQVTKIRRESQQMQGTKSPTASKGLRKMGQNVASSVDVAVTAVFRRPHRNKQRQGEKENMEVEVARSDGFFGSSKRNLAQLWGGST